MNEEIEVTPDQLRVLSNTSRLQILTMLFEREMTLSQMAEAVKLTPATVHHHIAQLLKANIIMHARSEVKGNLVEKYYAVPATGIDTSRIWDGITDREKTLYRLSTLGLVKGMVNASIKCIQARENLDYEVGSVYYYRLPWTREALEEAHAVLEEAAEKLEALEKKHEPGAERVTAVLTMLPC
jgi:DNA-binding transcriptional ArsR family regulator